MQRSALSEVRDEDGLRNLVTVIAIHRVCDVDELQEECYLTVASRTILVGSLLDKLREVLEGWEPTKWR